MKKQLKKRGFGLMALALSSLLSVTGGRMAIAQTTDPEAEGSVKIWLNNTDTATDDVLPQGGSLPCQAHLEGAGKDMTVVLVIPPLSSTNSARRVSFSNTSIVSAITLTLKSDGTPSAFTIYGVSGSLDVGDGKIEAHKDTAGGDLKTTGAASVYWFNKIEMLIDIPSTYSTFVTSQNSQGYATQVAITPYSGVGANLWATIDLMPSKSLGNSPQLSKFKVAVVQNAYANNGAVIDWETTQPNAANKYLTITSLVPKRADDVARGSSGPTYNQPASLVQGSEITSDTPVIANIPRDVTGPGGANYHLKTASFNNNWDDWCILYDSSIGKVDPYAAVSNASVDKGWNLYVNLYETVKPQAVHLSVGNMVLTNDSTQFANNLAKQSPDNYHN